VGEVQASQGKFLQAEQTYQEALHLARELREPRPRLVAIILNNLADLYVDLERFAEARF
jgi:Flp pilus assembly protein TadD